MAGRKKIILFSFCLLCLAGLVSWPTILSGSLARVDATSLRGRWIFTCTDASQPTKFIVTIDANNKFFHGEMVQNGRTIRLHVLHSGTHEFRTIRKTKPWIRYILHENVATSPAVMLYRNQHYTTYCTATVVHQPN